MSQPTSPGPPWNSVDEMMGAYRSRLSAPIAPHELFYYRNTVQYEHKLTVYGSVLSALGEAVGSLLDVGCGMGSLLTFYTPVDRYLGVDVIPELIAIAQKTHPRYHFLAANILSAELARHDTVTLIGVLGTSPQPLELLRRTSGLALKHLVFDYLPSTGSAARSPWLRTIVPHRIADLLAEEGWTASHIQMGTSTVIVVCERS